MSLKKLVENELRKQLLLEEIIKESPAYWISPDNFVIPVGITHIDLILLHPEKFGLDMKYIKKVFKKHNEPVAAIEGPSRNEIMTDLINRGWIRLRFHPREMVWVVQIPSLTPEIGSRIQSWSSKIIKSQPIQKNAVIQVLDLNANPIISHMEDIRLSSVAKGSKNWTRYVNTGGKLTLAQRFHGDSWGESYRPIEVFFLESITKYFPLDNLSRKIY